MWQLNDERLQPCTDAPSYNFCSSDAREQLFLQTRKPTGTMIRKGESKRFKLYVHNVTGCCFCNRNREKTFFTFNPQFFFPLAPVSWYLQPNVVTQVVVTPA